MAKVAWGLIGCGDIARKRVAPALCDSPSSKLVAVSRAKTELAEVFAKTVQCQQVVCRLARSFA